nr:6-phosphofructokinase [Candidatus Enterousia merdequi]
MNHKRIGIMTTGGDCSGLNTVIQRIADACANKKWEAIGIKDGTDGLCCVPAKTINLTDETFQFASSHLAGSILSNGHDWTTNFESSAIDGKINIFNKKLQKSLKDLNLDAMVL